MGVTTHATFFRLKGEGLLDKLHRHFSKIGKICGNRIAHFSPDWAYKGPSKQHLPRLQGVAERRLFIGQLGYGIRWMIHHAKGETRLLDLIVSIENTWNQSQI